jgi:hypothetical protein
MQFTEIKETLSGERLEYPCRLLEQSEQRVVLRYDLAHSGGIAGVALPAGTICFAYYWIDHPYNVYHWMNHEGDTIAFYINLSGPTRIGRDYVEWTDLIVDVLLIPDPQLGYRVQILDEDEIPEELDDATVNHIYAALEEVMQAWPALVRSLSEHSARLRHRSN